MTQVDLDLRRSIDLDTGIPIFSLVYPKMTTNSHCHLSLISNNSQQNVFYYVKINVFEFFLALKQSSDTLILEA